MGITEKWGPIKNFFWSGKLFFLFFINFKKLLIYLKKKNCFTQRYMQ